MAETEAFNNAWPYNITVLLVNGFYPYVCAIKSCQVASVGHRVVIVVSLTSFPYLFSSRVDEQGNLKAFWALRQLILDIYQFPASFQITSVCWVMFFILACSQFLSGNRDRPKRNERQDRTNSQQKPSTMSTRHHLKRTWKKSYVKWACGHPICSNFKNKLLSDPNLYTLELSLFSFNKLPGVFSEDCCFHIMCHLRQLKQLSHDTSLLKKRNKEK